MIGILVGEDNTYIEVKPIFANFKLGFIIKLPKIISDIHFGEYGISFSKDFTTWVHWGDTTHLYYPQDIFINIGKKWNRH